jgi:DNA repair protein RadC
LKEACRLMEMSLLDHIIIGHDRYWSFAEKGEL